MRKKLTDEEFISLWKRHGSAAAVQKATGMSVRGVLKRRHVLEGKGVTLMSDDIRSLKSPMPRTFVPDNRRVIQHEVKNGNVFIASDCHYWPGEETTAHKAFVKLLNEMKPQTIVLNGDVFDGARISRHEPLMGTNPPTAKQEIEACVDRLDESANASKNARKFWTFGNHDVRLHRYIAMNAPELTDALNLFDYFPGWLTSWRVDINDVIVKHRWHNGIHATYNNTLKSGRSIVTGHLHRLQAATWADYNGRRWGVDSGTLAEPTGEQFVYTEMNPTPWASGFVVLTFLDGKLLTPEFCEVLDGVAYFRGKPV